jgi:hypothetical protein
MGVNRRFGFVLAGACAALYGVGRWHSVEARPWLVAAAVVLAITLTIPRILAPLRRGWLKVGELLHRLVSPVLLFLFYFAGVTPVGLVMRALRKDPLRLKSGGATYWIERVPPGPDPRTMSDPF